MNITCFRPKLSLGWLHLVDIFPKCLRLSFLTQILWNTIRSFLKTHDSHCKFQACSQSSWGVQGCLSAKDARLLCLLIALCVFMFLSSNCPFLPLAASSLPAYFSPVWTPIATIIKTVPKIKIINIYWAPAIGQSCYHLFVCINLFTSYTSL